MARESSPKGAISTLRERESLERRQKLALKGAGHGKGLVSLKSECHERGIIPATGQRPKERLIILPKGSRDKGKWLGS